MAAFVFFKQKKVVAEVEKELSETVDESNTFPTLEFFDDDIQLTAEDLNFTLSPYEKEYTDAQIEVFYESLELYERFNFNDTFQHDTSLETKDEDLPQSVITSPGGSPVSPVK